MNCWEAARACAARNWRVFPVAPNDKEPLTRFLPHGLKNATTDVAIIDQWWLEEPFANLGLPCGDNGLVVVDFDLHKPGAGEAKAALGELPPMLVVSTPSGGEHHYFASADEIPTSRDRLGKAIDVQGKGVYVVAPPSIRNGRHYEIARRAPIATLPSWLREKMGEVPKRPAQPRSRPAMCGRSTAYGAAALRKSVAEVGSAQPGGRNRSLHLTAYSLGGLVASGHLAEGDVFEALLSAAVTAKYADGEHAAAGVIQSSLRAGIAAGARGPVLSTAY